VGRGRLRRRGLLRWIWRRLILSLLAGKPWWHEAHQSWWQVPSIGSIVEALRLAYEAERGVSAASVAHAQQFNVEVVWRDHWHPFLKGYFNG
jgi:hypothetical protein